MQTLDLVVIIAYLIGSAWLGLALSGKQANLKGYFLGNRDLPWWAVCLSVVATETSALTVISVPTIAYLGTLTFIQVAIGYLIGRIVVAFVLLPRYYRGEMATAYAYLGLRFGRGMQSTASVTFLFTRLLADGVRLFAAAIPMKVILDAYGIELSFFAIIAILGIVTVLYTFIGGIRAVVWVDTLQMTLYAVGGVIALLFIIGNVDVNFWSAAADAGKTQILDFTSNPISAPYAFVTAVIGGALLSTASHGADQIIVQRLLTCRTLNDARKAVIGSAVVVFVQFALFLTVGLGLWTYYQGQSPEELGLQTGDQIFPTFIVEALPAGISGLLLAGIMASAMSTLSSSLSALSSSTMSDLYEKFSNRALSDEQGLRLGRIFTAGWGLVFIGAAALFTGTIGEGILAGLKIVAVAIVAQAVLGMAKTLTPDRQRAAIAAVAALAALLLAGSLGQIMAIVLGGIAGYFVCRAPAANTATAVRFQILIRASGISAR